MPPATKRLDTHIFNFETGLTRADVELLALDSEVERVQCTSTVEPNTWELLNEILFVRRPEIELRVYGFYSSVCDLSFLHRVSNVRRFSADCLLKATGIENLQFLTKLKELSIGIYDLQDFSFLTMVPRDIKKLSIGATFSKKPRLHQLSRFHELRRLYLEGQQNGIEVLSELLTLEEITLRSISTNGLEYLSGLPGLWSLDVKLGGIADFSAIESKASIKYLELWQVRGLSDLGFISSLTGLQYLFLQSLRNVAAIPDLSKLAKLRRLHLETMKGLRDISAIAEAPALEEFTHVSAQNFTPGDYAALLRMPTLKSVRVGFGSQKKNKLFAEQAMQFGKNSDAGGKLGTRFVFE
jgi:hypothetical protein